MIENTFISYVCVSVTVSLIALLLTLAKPLTSRFFSPRWHYFVTACLVLIMLVPICINLPGASEAEAVNTVPYHGETYTQTKPVEIAVADEAIVPNSHSNVIHKYTGTHRRKPETYKNSPCRICCHLSDNSFGTVHQNEYTLYNQ